MTDVRPVPRRAPPMHRIASTTVLCLTIAACDAGARATAPHAEPALFSQGWAPVAVCHYDSDAGSFARISVAAPAVPAHRAHGDVLPGDRLPDDAGVFGPDCEPVPDPLVSHAHFMLPPDHSFVIGIGAIGANLFAFTTTRVYTLPLTATSGPLTEHLFGPQEVGVRATPESWAIPSLLDPNFAYFTGGLGNTQLFYTYRFDPQAQTSVRIDAVIVRPTGLAVEASTGAVFFSRSVADGAGVSKLSSASNGTPTLTFGSTGPGTLTTPGALAFGPDGLLYVLDTAVNRVFSFDSDGVYQSDFSLVGTAANTLAIDATGRLFTATGGGGGEIYDSATGSYLGAYAPSVTGDPSLGKPLLTIADGRLFLFDPTTGLHAYALSSLQL